ncbi:Xan family putative trans-acting RiPP leader peptide [Vitiosangium sp. GDMCC 1.1324]|uniref:Xan family putative trans-acting RiPP leader peptide n=1 Tax=Vitiosangium sp. (strain GDMCC 1.1324) TaxID=2138576 RepID=UPI0011B42043|nr:Xan family putative trans-acting RiPP leader peptide [Vitiosangium sp. GDMCC 1.1324]
MALEETTPVSAEASATESTPSVAAAAPAVPEKLDELEEINFLLEEIESKIAPLALA